MLRRLQRGISHRRRSQRLIMYLVWKGDGRNSHYPGLFDCYSTTTKKLQYAQPLANATFAVWFSGEIHVTDHVSEPIRSYNVLRRLRRGISRRKRSQRSTVSLTWKRDNMKTAIIQACLIAIGLLYKRKTARGRSQRSTSSASSERDVQYGTNTMGLFVRVICYEGQKWKTARRKCSQRLIVTACFGREMLWKMAIIQACLVVIQLQRTSSRAQPRAAVNSLLMLRSRRIANPKIRGPLRSRCFD